MHSLSKPLGLLGVAVLGTAWAQTDAKQPPCKKLSDIYTGGKELCENMWDGAFEYSFDEDSAYSESRTQPSFHCALPLLPHTCPQPVHKHQEAAVSTLAVLQRNVAEAS